MGLWEKIKGEFVDIIEWLDSTQDTLVYRFERYANEIKFGAKLVVREGQTAVFVNQGQIADIFRPGTYTLETQNLPVLSTLQGWKYGFSSPFKAEVYFANMRLFTDLKWGTRNPIMMRDAEFGPLRFRAFGTYAVRVGDTGLFFRQIVGTDSRFTAEEITEQLRNFIVSRFSDLLGEKKIPALDLAANYDELGQFVTERLKPEFAAYGLELHNLLIENISLPAEVEAAIDKRTSMGVVGNLDAYTRFQTANSIPDAARNPGGLAAAGAGMGIGLSMAGQVVPALNPQAGTAPPPLPPAFFVAQAGQRTGPFSLEALKGEADLGRLTRETLVWRQGLADWTPAGQLADLSSVFAGLPPPLPSKT